MVTEHADPQTGHRHERPEDWGWHAEMGKTARIAGIFCMLFLATFLLSTHGSRWELVWLIGSIAAIGASLIWDHYRRRNSWRS